MKRILILVALFAISCQKDIDNQNDFKDFDIEQKVLDDLTNTDITTRNTGDNLHDALATYTEASFDFYFDLYTSNPINGLGQMSEQEFYDFISTNFDIASLEIALEDLYSLLQVYLQANSVEDLMEYISDFDNEQLWENYILEHADDPRIPSNLRTLTGGLPCYQQYRLDMNTAVTDMQLCATAAGVGIIAGAGWGGLVAGLYCLGDMASSMNHAGATYELCLNRYN